MLHSVTEDIKPYEQTCRPGAGHAGQVVLCLRVQELFDIVLARDPRTSVTSDSVRYGRQGTACLASAPASLDLEEESMDL